MYSLWRNLGLAFVVVLGLGAIGASAAPADVFHSEQSTTTLKAEALSTHVFKATPADEKEFTCKKTSFGKGTLEAKSTIEFLVTPKYEECEATGPLKAFFEVEGCQYAFDGETDESEHGEMQIVCPEGKELRITVTSLHLKCIAIPSQTVEGIHYTDQPHEGGTTRDFAINTTATGVVSTTEESTASCGTGIHEGTYNGKTTVQGQNVEKSAVGIWLEPSDKFHAEMKNAVLSTEALGPQVIESTVGEEKEITCQEVTTAEATMETASTEQVEFAPLYAGCTAIDHKGEAEATAYIEQGSCEYLLRGDTVGEPEEALATAYLTCEEAEDKVTIRVTALKIKCFSIPEQTLHGVRYATAHEGEGSSREIDLSFQVTGLVTTTEDTVPCPTESGEVEVDEEGILTGEIALGGANTEEEAVGVWVG
jgi:hypothetical protein